MGWMTLSPGTSLAWSDSTTKVNIQPTMSNGGPISVTSNGDTYQLVSFKGSFSSGAVTLTAPSATTTRYAVLKTDASGDPVWGTIIVEGTGDALGIAADESGNAYVSGQFSGTAAVAGTSLTSAGGNDGYVAKFGPNGAGLWARRLGGTVNDWAHGVGVDGSGNVYVSAGFQGTSVWGSTSLVSAGSNDLGVGKLDGSGNWQWAQSFGGVGDDNGGWRQGLAVDAAGNAYVSGQIASSFTVNGTSYNTLGGRDAVVAKINTSGTWQWLATGGSTSSENVYGVAVDSSGNAYIGGVIRGASTFGPVSVSFTGVTDAFVAKVNSAGTWQWVRTASGTGNEGVYALTASATGDVVAGGSFDSATTSIDGESHVLNGSGGDAWVAKWNTSGVRQWSLRAGGELADTSYGAGIDGNGTIYVSGNVAGPASNVVFGSGTASSFRVGCATDCTGAMLCSLSAAGGIPAAVTTTTTVAPTTTVALTTTVPASTTTVASSVTVAPTGTNPSTPTTTVASSGTGSGTSTVRSGTSGSGGSASATTAVPATSVPASTTTVPSPATTTTVKAPAKPAGVSLGTSAAVVNGKAVSTALARSADRIVLTIGDLVASFAGSSQDGKQISLDQDGNLRVMPGDVLDLSLEGVRGESEVSAWLFSDPVSIGSATATASGLVTGRFTVPFTMEKGNHTLVLNLRNSLNEEVEVGLGIAVGAMPKGPSTMRIVLVLLSLAAVLAVTLPVALRKRHAD